MGTTLEEPNTQPTEIFALAADRERRYQERVARVRADTTLDERLRERLIGDGNEQPDEGSREIWGTKQISEAAGLSMRGNRLSVLRANAAIYGTPHPSSFPPMDAVAKRVPGWEVIDPGNERGAVEEFLWLTGRIIWNYEIAEFELAPKRRRTGRRRKTTS